MFEGSFSARSPEFWSAVAGGFSAFAAMVSLVGLAATYFENRRSANYAEAAFRLQFEPRLVPTIDSYDVTTIHLLIKNVGHGTAFGPVAWFHPTYDVEDRWSRRGILDDKKHYNKVAVLHNLHPLNPGESCELRLDRTQAGYEYVTMVLDYQDAGARELQCHATLYMSDEKPTTSVYLGYADTRLKRSTGRLREWLRKRRPRTT